MSYRHRQYLRFASGMVLAACLILSVAALAADENSIFRGKVTDTGGMAVEGAMVFVYRSTEVRRSADFISAPTDKTGLFRLVLTPGRYWASARLKKTKEFGPLMPGDRHSGEPREFEVAGGQEFEMNFVVTDIKEAIRARKTDKEGPVSLSGKIIDENGVPVKNAYAIAHRKEKISGIPDYLSAWTDSEGRYTLLVPRGTYYIGSAAVFPPGTDAVLNQAITVDKDRPDLDVSRKAP